MPDLPIRIITMAEVEGTHRRLIETEMVTLARSQQQVHNHALLGQRFSVVLAGLGFVVVGFAIFMGANVPATTIGVALVSTFLVALLIGRQPAEPPRPPEPSAPR